MFVRLPSRDGKTREGRSWIRDYAIVAGTDDPAALTRSVDTLASRFNGYFRNAHETPDDDGKRQLDPPDIALERLPAPSIGYQVVSPTRLVDWLEAMRPTILIRGSSIAMALSPDSARVALEAEEDASRGWKPDDELARGMESLPENLTFLAIDDTPASALPVTIAGLPQLVQLTASELAASSGPRTGPAAVFGLLGIPSPGDFRLRIDPSSRPAVETLRNFLAPTLVAAGADDRGYRLLVRESFPLSVLLGNAEFRSSLTMSVKDGVQRNMKFRFGLGD
jgi:hypothetical protein